MRFVFIIASVFALLASCSPSAGSSERSVGEVSDQQSIVAKEEVSKYASGGFASIVIDRPASLVFKMLTDVNTWTKINLGVTKTIEPENVVLEKGTTFYETIASPIPGFEDWKNAWTIEEFVPGERFVMSGRDNFTKTPIYSRITYSFTSLSETSTLFKRTIEVTIDHDFVKQAKAEEVEALYRFLGSQWEMATHLKKYVEANSSN